MKFKMQMPCLQAMQLQEPHGLQDHMKLNLRATTRNTTIRWLAM